MVVVVVCYSTHVLFMHTVVVVEEVARIINIWQKSIIVDIVLNSNKLL